MKLLWFFLCWTSVLTIRLVLHFIRCMTRQRLSLRSHTHTHTHTQLCAGIYQSNELASEPNQIVWQFAAFDPKLNSFHSISLCCFECNSDSKNHWKYKMCGSFIKMIPFHDALFFRFILRSTRNETYFSPDEMSNWRVRSTYQTSQLHILECGFLHWIRWAWIKCDDITVK